MLTRQETENEYLSGGVVLSMPRDLVITTGDDAASFLNGQLSQAVETMTIGESRWSLLLDPKGKVVAWLRVTRIEDNRFWLDTDPGTGQTMLTRLNRFVLRTRVKFELVETDCFAVRGAILPPRPPATRTQASVNIGWSGAEGYDIIGPQVSQPEGPIGDSGTLEALRIRAGAPAMGKEFQRATIPAETGVVEISADFGKGCYTGQELVARVNSRGNNTPRKVHKWTADLQTGVTDQIFSEVPSELRSTLEGAALFEEEDEVGTVTSVARHGNRLIGLASVKRGTDVSRPVRIPLGSVMLSATLHEHQILTAASG